MTFDPIPSVIFDSGALPDGQGFELWREAQDQFFELAPDTDPHQFKARIAVWNMNGLLLTDGHYSAQRFSRDIRRARADGFDHYTFLLHRRGRWLAEADDRATESVPGHVCVIDFARPIVTDVSDNDSMTLTVPRAVLDEVLPPFDMHGLRLDGGCGDLLADFLLSLPRRVGGLATADAPHVAEATRHMLAACLAPSRETAARAQPQIDGVLLHRAAQIVDAHLHDPGWGVDRLGAALRVSRSTLYRLFAPFGGVAEYVKSRRLTRAHIMLTDRKERRSIAAVALHCGFQSDTSFSRAFRQSFGYSPREARDAVAAGMPRHRRIGTTTDEAPFIDWIRRLR